MPASSENSSSIPSSLTSSSSDYNVQQLPKLDTVKLSENSYVIWKHHVLLVVEGYGLMSFLSDHRVSEKSVTNESGITVDNPIYLAYLKQDKLLASWLLSTISSDVLPHLTGLTSSQAIWNALARRYGAKSASKVSALRHNLHSQKKRNMSVSEYLAKIKLICDTLNASGNVVTEQEQVSVILAGLTAELESVITFASRGTQSLDTVSEMLFECEARQNEFLSDNFSVQANIATHTSVKSDEFVSKDDFSEDQLSSSGQFSRGSRGGNFFRGRGRGRYNSNRPQCQLCGKFGHLVLKCFHRFDPNFQGQNFGSNSSRGGSFNQQHFNFRPRLEAMFSGYSSPPIQAYSHVLSPSGVYAPSSHVPFLSNASFSPGPVPFCIPSSPSNVVPSAPISSMYAGVGGNTVADSRDVVWYPDSGATHHITNDRANLQSDVSYTGCTDQGASSGGDAHT